MHPLPQHSDHDGEAAELAAGIAAIRSADASFRTSSVLGEAETTLRALVAAEGAHDPAPLRLRLATPLFERERLRISRPPRSDRRRTLALRGVAGQLLHAQHRSDADEVVVLLEYGLVDFEVDRRGYQHGDEYSEPRRQEWRMSRALAPEGPGAWVVVEMCPAVSAPAAGLAGRARPAPPPPSPPGVGSRFLVHLGVVAFAGIAVIALVIAVAVLAAR